MRKLLLTIIILITCSRLVFAQTATVTVPSGLDTDYLRGDNVWSDHSFESLTDVNSVTGAVGRILVGQDGSWIGADLSGDATINVNGALDIANSGVTAGTYNAATFTVAGDGRVTAAAASSLTGLSDVNSATQGNGRLLVSDGTKFQSVSLLTVNNTVGNVGINTTSPRAKLEVFGSGNVGIGTASPMNTLQVNGTFQVDNGSSMGWSVQSSANQACNTTCVSGCVMGMNTAALGNFLACTDATSDTCLCSGSN